MGKQYSELNDDHIAFIKKQHIFFTGTAPVNGKVNISPKGMDSFRVLGNNRIAWLSVTGSGNETAAHVLENGRMTIMFCAFEGKPMILRLYGLAKVIYQRDEEWDQLIKLFPSHPGTRQLFDMKVELVQTSCGMSVPYYEFKEDRNQLNTWAEKQGHSGISAYWEKKNQKSLDGLDTGIFE